MATCPVGHSFGAAYDVTAGSRPMLVGVCNAACHGYAAGQATTVYNAGVRWHRGDAATVGEAAEAVARGFQVVSIVANTADGTPLTDASITTTGRATQSVSDLTNNPDIVAAEFMNEPYFKGNENWPVIYGRLYMAALIAVRNAGFTQPLLFCARGDFPMPQTTLSCTTTAGSAVATCASTENLTLYQAITGSNLQSSTAVATVDSKTRFTMNKTATGSGSTSLTFGTYWSHCADQDGGNAGGWLAKACYNVTGLAAAIAANGIVLHPYGGVSEDSGGHCSGLASVGWLVTHFASLLGSCPPLYITEFGYRIDAAHVAGEATGAYAHDTTDQATKIGAGLAYFKTLPAVVFAAVYQSHGNDGVGLGWGVMEEDGTARPSLATIGAVAGGDLTVNVAETVRVLDVPSTACLVGRSLYMPYAMAGGVGAPTVNVLQAVSVTDSAIAARSAPSVNVVQAVTVTDSAIAARPAAGLRPLGLTRAMTVLGRMQLGPSTQLGVGGRQVGTPSVQSQMVQSLTASERVVVRDTVAIKTTIVPVENVTVRETVAVLLPTLLLSAAEAVAIADTGVARIHGSRQLGSIIVTTVRIYRPASIQHARALGAPTVARRQSQSLVHVRGQGSPRLSARALPPGITHVRVIQSPHVNTRTLAVASIDRVYA